MGAEVNFQGHSLSPYLVLFPRFSEIMAENCDFFKDTYIAGPYLLECRNYMYRDEN